MGNNQAYTDFEAAVIAEYNGGQLTTDRLDEIGRRWEGMDVDHGGSAELTANDGLTADEIVARLFNPERVWPDRETDDYWDAVDNAVYSVTRDRWGWW